MQIKTKIGPVVGVITRGIRKIEKVVDLCDSLPREGGGRGLIKRLNPSLPSRIPNAPFPWEGTASENFLPKTGRRLNILL
jgi:hypothetical protein